MSVYEVILSAANSCLPHQLRYVNAIGCGLTFSNTVPKLSFSTSMFDESLFAFSFLWKTETLKDAFRRS